MLAHWYVNIVDVYNQSINQYDFLVILNKTKIIGSILYALV